MANVMVSKDNKPYRYLVIGNGRWALHLKKYLELLNISFAQWNRSLDLAQLTPELDKCTHVLLCISDSALESFSLQHLKNFKGHTIHFSGALEIPGLIGIHPLMTFGTELYPLDVYQNIPMVTTSVLSLDKILPGFSNSLYRIKPEEKAYYHALCVLGGNLTTLLIQKMIMGMKELRLPQEIGQLYLQQMLKNVFANPEKSLTGPLARKDLITVAKNLESLHGDPFADVYQSFLPIAFPEKQQRQGPVENLICDPTKELLL